MLETDRLMSYALASAFLLHRATKERSCQSVQAFMPQVACDIPLPETWSGTSVPMRHGNQMSGKTSQKARPRGVGRPPRQKARKRSIIAFEMVRLDRASVEPIHQQLYRQIRQELETGSFGNGSWRLPSSRALAADLGHLALYGKAGLWRDCGPKVIYAPMLGSGTFMADPLCPKHFMRALAAKRSAGKWSSPSAIETGRETAR